MPTFLRTAPDLLEEIRTVCTLQYAQAPDLLTTDRRGRLEAAWTTDDTTCRRVLERGDNRQYREREQRLLGLVNRYTQHPDADPDRATTPDPRFPRSVVLRLTPPVTRCPQCGATDTEGTGALDGLLDRWHDTEGSGWQCHNTACQWYAVDGESE